MWLSVHGSGHAGMHLLYGVLESHQQGIFTVTVVNVMYVISLNGILQAFGISYIKGFCMWLEEGD